MTLLNMTTPSKVQLPFSIYGDVFLRTRATSTGSSFDRSGLTATALLLLMLSAPTGINSIYNVAQSSQKPTQIPYYDVVPAELGVSVRTLRSRLKSIRQVLSISVSELADIFGVSRQAVYKWLSGGPISNLNRRKLDDLSDAAHVLAPFSDDGFQIASKRLDTAGNDLMAALRKGTALAWANDVARAIGGGRDKRRAIDLLVSSHRRSAAAGSDLGVPLLDERTD